MGTHSVDELTRMYGTTRELNDEILRYNHREYLETLARVLKQNEY
jgi:hypothetical protein